MELDTIENSRAAEPVISQIWNDSNLRIAAELGHYELTNTDAIGYCLDHETLVDRDPHTARVLHRLIDIYGRDTVVRYLCNRIRLV